MAHLLNTLPAACDNRRNTQTLNAVRAAFVAQGSSLNDWCRRNGVHRQNATAALTGTWRGPAARDLVQRLLAEAGIAA